MKEYPCSLGVKILTSFFCFAFIVLGLYSFFYDISKPPHVRLLGLLCSLFSLLGVFSFWGTRIIITREKLQCICNLISFKTNQEIVWSTVNSISTDYFFVPQFCIFKIIGKTNEGRNKIELLIMSFPVGLLRDIFERVPATTKIDLYPWLRKELIKKGVNLNRFSDDSGNS